MQSTSESFENFIFWIISTKFISKSDLDIAMESLGGMTEVIEENLFISAYEELGRYLTKKYDYSELYMFVMVNNNRLSEYPEYFYYFIESIADELSVNNADIKNFIEVCPEEYREFLTKRYA